MNIALWILQVLLAVVFLGLVSFVAYMRWKIIPIRPQNRAQRFSLRL